MGWTYIVHVYNGDSCVFSTRFTFFLDNSVTTYDILTSNTSNESSDPKLSDDISCMLLYTGMSEGLCQ